MSKPEDRIPEGQKKAEIRRPKNGPTRIDSDFGLLSGFGHRAMTFATTIS